MGSHKIKLDEKIFLSSLSDINQKISMQYFSSPKDRLLNWENFNLRFLQQLYTTHHVLIENFLSNPPSSYLQHATCKLEQMIVYEEEHGPEVPDEHNVK